MWSSAICDRASRGLETASEIVLCWEADGVVCPSTGFARPRGIVLAAETADLAVVEADDSRKAYEVE